MDEAAEKSTTLDILGEVLGVVRAIRDVGGKPVVPVWLIPVAAVIAATVVVLFRHMNLLGFLRAWAKAATPPPEWDPEKGTGPLSPPMDIPEGGITVPGPGDRWERNEP